VSRPLLRRASLSACVLALAGVAFMPVRHFGPGSPWAADPGQWCGSALVAFFESNNGCHDAAASRLYWLALPGTLLLAAGSLRALRDRPFLGRRSPRLDYSTDTKRRRGET
jgi:hypothetical protein